MPAAVLLAAVGLRTTVLVAGICAGVGAYTTSGVSGNASSASRRGIRGGIRGSSRRRQFEHGLDHLGFDVDDIARVLGSSLSGLFGEVQRFDAAAVPWYAWAGLAYMIVAGSLWAFSAYVWLIGVISPTRVATYAFINPVIAVIEKSLVWFGAGGLALGLVVGLGAGWLIGRRGAARGALRPAPARDRRRHRAHGAGA